jgi:hypothetical protein
VAKRCRIKSVQSDFGQRIFHSLQLLIALGGRVLEKQLLVARNEVQIGYLNTGIASSFMIIPRADFDVESLIYLASRLSF